MTMEQRNLEGKRLKQSRIDGYLINFTIDCGLQIVMNYFDLNFAINWTLSLKFNLNYSISLVNKRTSNSVYISTFRITLSGLINQVIHIAMTLQGAS
jgi:hypothetical protein